jgi:hypothetical protein
VRIASGPVFDSWEAQTSRDGLRLTLTLRCFHDGFLDISPRLTNEAAEHTTNVYAAVVCRWEQMRLRPLDVLTTTSPRSE